MQTPDGVWRVEVYRKRLSVEQHFRLINTKTGETTEGLGIGTVEFLLTRAGVDMADLTEAA